MSENTLKSIQLSCLIAVALLSGCTVDLQRCVSDDACPANQVCRLDVCVLGGSIDQGATDQGQPDQSVADLGQRDLDVTDMGAADFDVADVDQSDFDVAEAGPLDGGPPFDLPIVPIGPARLTELGDAEFRVARFEILGVPAGAELRLTLQAIEPLARCAITGSGRLELLGRGMNNFEADLVGLGLPYGCEVNFETTVEVLGVGAAPGPPLTVDNAPPAFDRQQVEIWPAMGAARTVVVDPAEATRMDFYNIECPAPDAIPDLVPLQPSLGDSEWTLAGPVRFGALVLSDDRGNIRCESIQHSRPDAPTIAQTDCLAVQPTRLVVENASAMRTFCLAESVLEQQPGHHPVLAGICSPPDETCEAFVRLGPLGPDATYGAITIQSHAEAVTHFTGPTRVTFDGASPVSHARIGDTLFVGTDAGSVAQIDVANGRWTRGAPLLSGDDAGIQLAATVEDGQSVLWIANHGEPGQIQRCFAPDFACDDLGALAGEVVQLAAAQLDDDAALEMVACTTAGMSVYGLDAAGFVAGPRHHPVANPACLGVAVGRLAPGSLDSLVVAFATDTPSVIRFDREPNVWRSLEFRLNTPITHPVIDDFDEDGLDDLFVVHEASPNQGKLQRVHAVNGDLTLPLAGTRIALPGRSVKQGAIGDFDQDGVPDLLAIEAVPPTGRLVYGADDAVRSTTLLGAAVHRADPLSGDLVVYGQSQIIGLRPSRPTTDLRWPAPIRPRLNGRLELAGFDLNNDNRDEFFFVGFDDTNEVRFAGFYEINELGGLDTVRTSIALPPADYRASRADVNGDGFEDVALAGQVGDSVHVYVALGGPVREDGSLQIARFHTLTPVLIDENPIAEAHTLLDISATRGELYVQTRVNGQSRVTAVQSIGMRGTSPLDADSIGTVHLRRTINLDGQIQTAEYTLGCRQAGQVVHAQTIPAADRAGLSRQLPDDATCQALHALRPSLPGLPLAVLSAAAGAQVQLFMVTDLDTESDEVELSAVFDLGSQTRPNSLDLIDFDGDLVPEVVVAVPSAPEVPGIIQILKTEGGMAHRYPDKHNHAGEEGRLLNANNLTALGGDFDGDGLRDLLIHRTDADGMGQFFVYPERD